MMAALLLAPSCAEPPVEKAAVKPVKTIKLTGAAASGQRIFPGTVQAAQKAELSFRVSGPLVRLPALEGQLVRKGATLAKIDSRDFQTRVVNLEAQLAGLQAEYQALQVARPEDIRTLEANLAAARARLVEANATFRRYQGLYANDNVSKAEFDQRRAARDVAEAEVKTAEASLEIGQKGARAEEIEAKQAQIRALEAQVAQARDELRDSSLLAPYDGVVAQVYADNFEYVQARQPIVSLQDISSVEIVAQVPESVISQRKRRQAEEPKRDFKVRFESLPGREFDAEITEISAQADPVTRTYDVTLRTPQPEEATILGGMTAEVLVNLDDGPATAFAVPGSAFAGDGKGQSFVWVLDETTMKTVMTPVRVGEMIGENALIIEGLSAGDTVITAGTSFLADGQQVRLITDELRERK